MNLFSQVDKYLSEIRDLNDKESFLRKNQQFEEIFYS